MTAYYPLIGIPCRTDTSGTYPGRTINTQGNAYIEAVLQTGGLPVLIPLQVKGAALEALFQRLDGLILAGGGDVDPLCYREHPQTHTLREIQPARDEQEIRLVNLATARRKPFFAICRGIQVMNVALGGTLWQDLPSQRPQTGEHDYYTDDGRFPRNYLAHEVTLEQDTVLNRILKTERLPVNSMHHQGVKKVASGLSATAYAEDGLVEALEVPGHPFGLGVQWHPEEMVADEETARQIFAAFIEAAYSYHKQRE
jgi:putative glutamine amidotransferase